MSGNVISYEITLPDTNLQKELIDLHKPYLPVRVCELIIPTRPMGAIYTGDERASQYT